MYKDKPVNCCNCCRDDIDFKLIEVYFFLSASARALIDRCTHLALSSVFFFFYRSSNKRIISTRSVVWYWVLRHSFPPIGGRISNGRKRNTADDRARKKKGSTRQNSSIILSVDIFVEFRNNQCRVKLKAAKYTWFFHRENKYLHYDCGKEPKLCWG